jgi:hypothetical protein
LSKSTTKMNIYVFIDSELDIKTENISYGKI